MKCLTRRYKWWDIVYNQHGIFANFVTKFSSKNTHRDFWALFPWTRTWVLQGEEYGIYCAGKVIAVQATKANGGMVPLMLHRGNTWRWVVNLTIRPLYPTKKRLCYSLQSRLIWFQNRPGSFMHKQHLVPIPEIEKLSLGCTACSHVTAEVSQNTITNSSSASSIGDHEDKCPLGCDAK